jgi:methyl-accepting chemotaxis protein
MFKSIRNMPIFRRLFIAFALATVIPGIIVGSLGAFYISALNTRTLAVKTSFDAQNAATDQRISLSRMNALLQVRFAQVFALNGKAIPPNDTSMYASTNLVSYELSGLEITFDRKLKTYQQSYDITTSDNMADIRHILSSDNSHNPVINAQHKTLHLVVTQQWVAYQKNLDKVLSLLQSPTDRNGNAVPYTPDYTVTYQALFETNKAYLDLSNSWQALVKDATIVGTTVTNISGPSFTTPLIGYTLVALLLTVLIIVGTGYIVDLTITKPLRQLVSLAKRIANGETDARAEIKGRDEIDAVASSINKMLEHIVRLVQEARDRHGNLQSQIDKLVNEVSGLGAGNLTIQAEVTMDELGMLAETFNYMTQELGDLVVRVKLLAKEVSTATTMSFERMTQLVQISALQIQQIDAATAKVGDMAASSRNVAERTQFLSDIAHNARYTAKNGKDSVEKAISAIDRTSQNMRITSEKVQVLGERSREIGDIVNVISSIAKQTNRLALDAAIQAAMAGENGKGFATVATDIRSLAERSKEQTLQIGRIVHTVLEDIHSATYSMEDTERETVTGVHLIDEAGRALDSVFSVVEQQANEIATIDHVATQQLVSSNAIVQIMQTVSASTRQSNTTTHETSQLMEHVALLAEQLHDSVHVFKVREESMQQFTSGTDHGFPVEKQLDRAALDSSQRATTQPLRRYILIPADQSASYPSTPYPITLIPETPAPLQRDYN